MYSVLNLEYVPPSLIPTPATASPQQPPSATFPAYQNKSDNGTPTSMTSTNIHSESMPTRTLGSKTKIVHPDLDISLVGFDSTFYFMQRGLTTSF